MQAQMTKKTGIYLPAFLRLNWTPCTLLLTTLLLYVPHSLQLSP